jgi:hypothetical protein
MEGRARVAQKIHDEKVDVMMGDLRRVGEGVFSVAKVVGMFGVLLGWVVLFGIVLE